MWLPGTMLFGEGNNYEEACQLLDRCMAVGVNFFDSAGEEKC